MSPRKLFFLGYIGILLLAGCFLALYWHDIKQHEHHSLDASNPASQPRISVYFSPKGGAIEAVIKEIKSAGKSIKVQVRSLASEPVTDALIDAANRGVAVEIIFSSKIQDPGRYSGAKLFRGSNIPALVDSEYTLAHKKIMIIDELTVITGNLQFTTGTEELMIIKNDPDITQKYIANYTDHFHRAKEYKADSKHVLPGAAH
jgi:phosphatidylserine/phosphatidylglycerophosphate/cardiolipin synthase-like enzyme